MMELREKIFLQNNYAPEGDIAHFQKGTYYLSSIDDKWRRFYEIAK